MQIHWAEQALTAEGWQKAVRIAIGGDGRIAEITPDAPPEGQRLSLLLPAPGNLHSHAFQRAMAGLTEARGPDPSDSFWTWRHLMYRFLDLLTPDDVEAITAFAQMEMLETGFASVGEFHYLHHQPGGAPYDAIGEMADRVLAARATSGIGLTLLPVLYHRGGCDDRPLAGGQLRFGNDLDAYAKLLDHARAGIKAGPADGRTGVAPHSLRAVSRESLDHLPALIGKGPVHIHIAEQPAEVTEVLAYFGARPLEWLLNIFHVDAAWCLIHATQMTPAETIGLAESGAVAGLCPITESSLGDGIFDGVRYLDHGGRFGFGTDSNILISLPDEIRTLDYSQRLRDNSRAALASATQSAGRRIFQKAASGAAQALGRGAGNIAVGEWADLLHVGMDHPDLDGLTGDTALDAWAFTGSKAQVRDVWAAGRHLVAEGQHIARAPITDAYRRVVRRLRARI
ncbi:MAG: formimidoylglutamate deiminase [Rhodobacteraceae bacterium]|nr:formimidoylglutamate deiminase [Paracoccaceae bacterium]